MSIKLKSMNPASKTNQSNNSPLSPNYQQLQLQGPNKNGLINLPNEGDQSPLCGNNSQQQSQQATQKGTTSEKKRKIFADFEMDRNLNNIMQD